jgi:hypothetical protein
MKKLLLSLFFIAGIAVAGHAQIFSQNFPTDGLASQYVDALGFASNKFTGISNNANAPSSVTGGKLTFTKTGSSGAYFAQTVNMNSQVLIVKFDFAVSGQVASSTSALIFHVGNNLSNNGNVITPAAGANSRFSINYEATAGSFSLRDYGNGANSANTYTGEKTITFAVNNKSSQISYTSPAGSIETLPANTWDLWIGTDKAFNDIAVENSSNPLSNFKLTMQSSVPNAVITFDNFTIINETDASVLPVSLTSFTAKANLQNVDLAWSTAGEKNNSHFDILRSGDGKTFTKIDEVKGAGTTDATKNYTYIDRNALPGISYYQLKQVDNDGTPSLSDVAVVKSNVAASNFKVVASKQESAVKLSVFAASEGKATFKIYDLNGRKLADQELTLSKGYSNVSVPFNGTTGLHIATLTTANETVSQKFIK